MEWLIAGMGVKGWLLLASVAITIISLGIGCIVGAFCLHIEYNPWLKACQELGSALCSLQSITRLNNEYWGDLLDVEDKAGPHWPCDSPQTHEGGVRAHRYSPANGGLLGSQRDHRWTERSLG